MEGQGWTTRATGSNSTSSSPTRQAAWPTWNGFVGQVALFARAAGGVVNRGVRRKACACVGSANVAHPYCLRDDLPSYAQPLRTWVLAAWAITSQKYGANALGLQRVSASRAARPRGPRSTSSDEPWCAPAGIDSMASLRSMRPMSEISRRARGRHTETKAIVAIAAEIVDEKRLGRVRMRSPGNRGRRNQSGRRRRPAWQHPRGPNNAGAGGRGAAVAGKFRGFCCSTWQGPPSTPSLQCLGIKGNGILS